MLERLDNGRPTAVTAACPWRPCKRTLISYSETPGLSIRTPGNVSYKRGLFQIGRAQAPLITSPFATRFRIILERPWADTTAAITAADPRSRPASPSTSPSFSAIVSSDPVARGTARWFGPTPTQVSKLARSVTRPTWRTPTAASAVLHLHRLLDRREARPGLLGQPGEHPAALRRSALVVRLPQARTSRCQALPPHRGAYLRLASGLPPRLPLPAPEPSRPGPHPSVQTPPTPRQRGRHRRGHPQTQGHARGHLRACHEKVEAAEYVVDAHSILLFDRLNRAIQPRP